MAELMFVDARWKGKIKLNNKIINYFKKNNIKSVALFASVQFLALDNVIRHLRKENIKVMTTKAKRCDEKVQVLGCDCYEDSFDDDIINEADAILYIGDGMFHPQALLFSQMHKKTIKEVIIWDPASKSMKIMTKKNIDDKIRKLKANIKRFIASKTVGILVSTKPGQQYLEDAKRLKEKLDKNGKKTFIFIDNNIDFSHLENYPFIDAWVNTACPRIGFDDAKIISNPMINLREAFEPIKALENLSEK